MGILQRRATLAPLYLLFSTVFTVGGADPEWPRFRGPESNPAVSKGKLPDKWSKTSNVEWVTEVPGRGWSSPIVNAGKIYLTAVTTEGKSKEPQTGTEYSNQYVAELVKQGLSQKEILEKVTARDIELPHEVKLHYFLYCVDLKSGKVLWKQEFHAGQPPGGRHRKNSFASETPITDGTFIYVYAANQGLYAYDLNGKQVWRTPLESYPIYLDFGTGGSAALEGNQLIIVNDNEKQQFIASFDKRTGKQLWRTNRDLAAKGGGPPQRSGWVTPYIWKTPLRTEIVTVGPGVAVSYDLEGKELWRLSGMAATPIPSPYSYDGLLYINGGRGRAIYAIKPGPTGDITPGEDGKLGDSIAWSLARSGTYLPTQVAYDGFLYVLNEVGIVSRIDAKTGKLIYKSRIENGGDFTSSPWAYDGKVFCLSEEGTTFVLGTSEKFEALQTNDLGEMAQATPAIVGDRLLLRTETKLYSIRK